jgi:hypothetical protein
MVLDAPGIRMAGTTIAHAAIAHKGFARVTDLCVETVAAVGRVPNTPAVRHMRRVIHPCGTVHVVLLVYHCRHSLGSLESYIGLAGGCWLLAVAARLLPIGVLLT